MDELDGEENPKSDRETPVKDPMVLLEPDSHLKFLSALSNSASLEIGIRLFVGGIVVSGTLTGGANYFEALASDLRASLGGDGARNPLADFYDSTADYYKSLVEDQNEDKQRTEYIHLRDAWWHAPGSAPTVVGLWRGRLSRIDAWALGNYDVVENES